MMKVNHEQHDVSHGTNLEEVVVSAPSEGPTLQPLLLMASTVAENQGRKQGNGGKQLNHWSHVLLIVSLSLPLVLRGQAAAPVTVLTGCAAVVSGCARSSAPAGEAETISKQDAQRFPFIGSAVLLSLFVLLRVLPPELVSKVLRAYMSLIGAYALAQCAEPAVAAASPHRLRSTISVPLHQRLGGKQSISLSLLLSFVLSAVFCAWYWHSQHWLANNAIATALALQFIEHAMLERVKDGLLLLGGLFVYDCFWVFGTPVMVEVARGIDGPIKLLFPKNNGPANALSKSDFSMLGLGDVVLPALFCAIALRIDSYSEGASGSMSRGNYFVWSAIGYAVGLSATEISLHIFNAAQPALLYIVPCVVGAVFTRAASKAEVRRVWRFDASQSEAHDKAQ